MIPADVPPARTRGLLLPREHGAWGQLVFPLATALLTGRPGLASLALTLGTAAVFLAHEPALVLLGHRGARTLREEGPRARAQGLALGAVGGTLGAVGLALGGPLTRWGALLPVALVALLAPFVLRRQERTTAGEVLAASALASSALPVALASRVPPSEALACWAVWSLVFAVATTAVRSVIARMKSQGEVGWLVPATVCLAAVSLGALGALASRGVVPWALALALVPVSLMALGLCAFPPGPKKLRTVGWALVSASAATTAILAAAS